MGPPPGDMGPGPDGPMGPPPDDMAGPGPDHQWDQIHYLVIRSTGGPPPGDMPLGTNDGTTTGDGGADGPMGPPMDDMASLQSWMMLQLMDLKIQDQSLSNAR